MVGPAFLAWRTSRTDRRPRGGDMRIGIVGTGTMATELARAWTGAGHAVVVAGRSAERATALAARIGPAVTAVPLAELAPASDAVVVAVSWAGVAQAVAAVHGPGGLLAGKPVLDCTNPVDFATGTLLAPAGSALDRVREAAPGAHVVKALHLFAGAGWPWTPAAGTGSRRPTVAMCGDHAAALDVACRLVSDLGARPAVVGGADRARQLEEVAG